MGLKVVAGDSSWSKLTRFNGARLLSPGGIRSRNEALTDSIAAYARHGRVTALLGGAHTGWGDKALPGVGQILAKKHGVLAPSVATPTIRNKEGWRTPLAHHSSRAGRLSGWSILPGRRAVYSDKQRSSTWRCTSRNPAARSASRMTGGGTQASMVSW
jgi:hypothetical protein